MLTGRKPLLKSKRQQFHQLFSSLWEEFSSKTSPLVISIILGLFVNTLTADGNFIGTLYHSQKLLSKKQKDFSQFFVPFLKSASYFEHFEKYDEPDRLYIFEIIDCGRRCYVNV